ncbi:MAG: DUF4386 domain-containing protein [Reichenbachiella sp.]
MTSTNKKVRIIGVLFLLQITTAIVSYSVMLDPILYDLNFIQLLAANEVTVTVAMILDLICGLSVFGIAVLLFPILKKYNERIALWYVGLRLNELVTFVIGGVMLLTLLSLSKTYQEADSSSLDSMAILAKSLLRARGNTQDISLFIYCFGTLMFYYLLFQTKLIPRFISVWGLIGVVLLFVEITANIFKTSAGGMMIMMPLGLNEIFLGFWLIFKGFDEQRLDA